MSIEQPQQRLAMRNNDYDNDDDDDDDVMVSSGSYYSSKDFPSLSSIAMYCVAIHSIPRIGLYTYTHWRDRHLHQNHLSTQSTIRSFGHKLARNPQIIMGGATCLTFFGLGLWQLDRLTEDWDVADDRYEQLQLEPLKYCFNRFGGRKEEESSSSSQLKDVLVGMDTSHNNSSSHNWLQQQKESLMEQPYRRRRIRGRFRHDKEVLIGPRNAPPGVPTKSQGAQGFCVLTPLEVESSDATAHHYPSPNNKNLVVWINRGWIPKTLLPKWTDRPHYYEPQIARVDKLLRERPPAWNRPEGIVEVTGVPSKTEQATPFLTPEHDFLTRPLQMFWIDGRSLKSIAGTDLYTPEELATDKDDVALVTQVLENNENHNHNDATIEKPHESATSDHTLTIGGEEEKEEESFLYPLLPPVSSIGKSETKHPFTHMGYAATWFGISGASWVMTRKLLTKGRF